MIDELRALAIFAEVVQTGSFRGAASNLALSPSVVSHHVSQLEARLGVALLYRSTRRLSLTDDGKSLFESTQRMLKAADEGLNRIAHTTSEPYGKLTLSLPALLSRSVLVDQIADFAKTYPKVKLSINFSDKQQDMIKDGIDLAIRIGDLKDSGLKSKKLFMLERVLVAAPSLIAMHKQARHPKDLTPWDWIGLKMRAHTKTLVHVDGKRSSIKFEPKIIVDSIDAACQFAIAGLGLATPPVALVTEDLTKGRLVELLPKWKVPSIPVYALWPHNAAKESLTHRLITHLAK